MLGKTDIIDITYSQRLHGLDRLRGLAIVLMVIDHLLVILDRDNLLRFTLTRAALPLFCLVAGTLFRRPGKRLIWVTAAGLFAGCIGLPLGIGQPDILLLLAFGFLLLPYMANLFGLVVALIQPSAWPLQTSGYEPGLVLSLLILGRLYVDPIRLNDVGEWFLPSWVGTIGRWPLTWYLGHLACLYILANLWV